MATFIPKRPTKEVISMRIATDLLEEVDTKAAAYGISRNELLCQMIQFALDNMEENHDK